MRTVYAARALWDGARSSDYPLIEVEEDRIVSIETRGTADLPAGKEVLNLGNAVLAPAFFDVHIHGAAGHDVMEASSDALGRIGSFLASRGTGNYLATTVTAPLDKTLHSLAELAKVIAGPAQPGIAKPVGIHLEGPFLSHSKRGVHPPGLLLSPDISVFDRMYEAAEGHVRLMTLAPELPGAPELAEHAIARGVRVTIGHSNATAEESRKLIEIGATSATHTFNAMRALDHREPGILGTVLTTDSLFAELICDGIHTAPEMVRLWWKAKGANRGILITDGMAATGMPEGTYQLGGFAVEVKNGRAMANGVLAGSVLTLDRALVNFLGFTGAALRDGLRLLTTNPAAMTGFNERVGTLAVGQEANFVILGEDGKLAGSIVRGKRAA